MDVKKFKEIKHRYQLASKSVDEPRPNSELEVCSELHPELVGKQIQPQELVDRSKPKLDPESQFSAEPGGCLESVAMIEREDSIGGSGWGYSKLLKEFRQ